MAGTCRRRYCSNACRMSRWYKSHVRIGRRELALLRSDAAKWRACLIDAEDVLRASESARLEQAEAMRKR